MFFIYSKSGIIIDMKFTVKLFASLRDFGPKYREIDLQGSPVLEDIIKTLNLPDNYPIIRLVNGEFAEPGQPLKEGDVIALFPPIAGG